MDNYTPLGGCLLLKAFVLRSVYIVVRYVRGGMTSPLLMRGGQLLSNRSSMCLPLVGLSPTWLRFLSSSISRNCWLRLARSVPYLWVSVSQAMFGRLKSPPIRMFDELLLHTWFEWASEDFEVFLICSWWPIKSPPMVILVESFSWIWTQSASLSGDSNPSSCQLMHFDATRMKTPQPVV